MALGRAQLLAGLLADPGRAIGSSIPPAPTPQATGLNRRASAGIGRPWRRSRARLDAAADRRPFE